MFTNKIWIKKENIIGTVLNLHLTTEKFMILILVFKEFLPRIGHINLVKVIDTSSMLLKEQAVAKVAKEEKIHKKLYLT
mgnify:CR=1 FL=1